MGFTGLILAAGRGSRLGGLTEARPKCLVELGGRPLLDWQVTALRAAGISRVVAVTGYRRELIEARGLETITNERWDRTNMVGTLMCALERLEPPFIVSYSDIVYGSNLARRLMDCPHDIAITYDLEWRQLWERRFRQPLLDAETFRIDKAGKLLEIGGKATRIEDIEGQFMGLIAINEAGAGRIRDMVGNEPELRASLDSTGLLMRLIESGQDVHGVPTRGGWCEIDDEDDLAVAEALLAEGLLPACDEE